MAIKPLKQDLFMNYITSGMEAIKAYEKAGYSMKGKTITIQKRVSDILRRPHNRKILDNHKAKIQERIAWDKVNIIAELTKMYELSVTDIIDFDMKKKEFIFAGDVQFMSQLPKEIIKFAEDLTLKPDGTFSFKLPKKIEILREISRLSGLYEDKVQVTARHSLADIVSEFKQN